MKRNISLNVLCPYCHKSLMDNEVKLSNYPSIKLNICTRNERGVIHLCSIYECYDHVSNIELIKGDVVEMCCPHCNKELLSKEECIECGAPMVNMVLKIGGGVSICSRCGCPSHYVAFQDIHTELEKFYEEYES